MSTISKLRTTTAAIPITIHLLSPSLTQLTLTVLLLFADAEEFESAPALLLTSILKKISRQRSCSSSLLPQKESSLRRNSDRDLRFRRGAS